MSFEEEPLDQQQRTERWRSLLRCNVTTGRLGCSAPCSHGQDIREKQEEPHFGRDQKIQHQSHHSYGREFIYKCWILAQKCLSKMSCKWTVKVFHCTKITAKESLISNMNKRSFLFCSMLKKRCADLSVVCHFSPVVGLEVDHGEGQRGSWTRHVYIYSVALLEGTLIIFSI